MRAQLSSAANPVKFLRRLSRRSFIVLMIFSLIGASFAGGSSIAVQRGLTSSSDRAGDEAASGADAPAATFTFSNNTSITINDRASGTTTSSAAAPFPSDINVSGIPGSVGKVTVTISGYNHTWPDDVDVLLVGPTGQTTFLMSDAGASNDAINTTLTFDDDAAAPVPDAAAIPSGAYRPANYIEETNNGTDTYPSPAPAEPYGATLSTFNGTNPNGVWKLFVADDENSIAGSISGGWSISITNSITAQNTETIVLPDSGTASLYPSQVDVNGLTGAVSDVSVILNNFNHTLPDDTDLMLVSPGGARRVVLMSDVGGANPVTNVTLTISDVAPTGFPDEGVLASGTFKPTNIGDGDVFPAPAPQAAPSGATMAAFSGINPNGTWSLYAVDDSGGNVGSFSDGWSLAIATSATSCGLNISPTLQAFPVTGGAGGFNVLPATGCPWTVVSNADFINVTSNSSGEGNAAINFEVAPNMGGGRSGTISVSTANFTRTFTVQQPSGCPFSLSQETLNFSAGGGSGNVSVTAAGVCGWTATTKENWITVNSGSGNGNGTVSLTVSNNPSPSERTGTVTIGARTLTIVQAGGTGISRAVLDFDGDGKSDYTVLRPAGGNFNWHVQQSAGGSANLSWGASDTVPVPGDYDGDGKWDLAVWQMATAPAAFYILRSQTNTFQAVEWGAAADDPKTTQDFDGDGKADPAVTRYESGILNWYIRESLSGNLRAVQFGSQSDVPVRGDFDGDGKADIAVYRRNSGSPANTFYVLRSSDGALQAATFGNYNLDYIVPADFDGDGKTDYAVWRGRAGGDGVWYWLQSSDGAFRAFQFGLAGTDQPSPGDYDGDGRTDQAVWRPGASATFYVNRSGAGFTFVSWGTSGDLAPGFSLQTR